MVSLSTGGGSSAVAASAHAGCTRYRHTDPLLTGMNRRAFAKALGHPDTSAGIPEARWMRAMIFERLVRDERFVSQLLTTAVGALGLDRPVSVRRVDGGVSVGRTAKALAQAHLKAVHESAATMITGLAVPFVGMEAEAGATPVKPDFAIVVPRLENGVPVGSWLVMGDAKDYERIRSRIDDHRMLKGFLQVALGAESARAWSLLPAGMEVHAFGALAVPRNSFLQPEAVVEFLADHCREVLSRVEERATLLAASGGKVIDAAAVTALAEHLEATFDPTSCTSCALFNFCRAEVRASAAPESLLVEIGVRRELRGALSKLLIDGVVPERAPASVVANVAATVNGLPEWTGQRRIDPVGLPGTIDVTIAKSDAAALGVHGLGLRRVRVDGTAGDWQFTVFDDPQMPSTRLAVMEVLGTEIDAAVLEFANVLSPNHAEPVHLIVPDTATGDVLVSIADSLAGVETSRLRWQRDLEQGRKALTYDGEPARIPEPLTNAQRTGVSFLLEEDRARAMVLRSPIVDVRAVLARHLIPGGPAGDAGRLDYLVEWGEAKAPLQHRAVSDAIAARVHTPGARLTNDTSDALHAAGRGGTGKAPDLGTYRRLVHEELQYKASLIGRAGAILAAQPVSKLRAAHRTIEGDAQVIWRRRSALHASDLVRFGRTYPFWRNNQVTMREQDITCEAKLRAVGNPAAALDMALDAGTRQVAQGVVTSVSPVRLRLASRRIGSGARIVLLHVNGHQIVELPTVEIKPQSGSFKLRNLPIGELTADAQTAIDGSLLWAPKVAAPLQPGDPVIVADASWFGKPLTSGHEINIERPKRDATNSPGDECHEASYATDPDGHRWCCRSHEHAEAEFADELAERRDRGELNPAVWPPIIDEDQFDTPAAGTPVDTDLTGLAGDSTPPADLTIDDLD
jgi:hypothetical protein